MYTRQIIKCNIFVYQTTDKTEKHEIYKNILHTRMAVPNDVAEMNATGNATGIKNNPFRRFWIGNNTDDSIR